MKQRIRFTIIKYCLLAQYYTSSFRRWESKTSKEIQEDVKKEISELLRYVQEHNPYFSNLLSGLLIKTDNCIEVLRNLPLLNKGIIRECGNSIYSDFVSADFARWQNTGGSTGEPLNFPVGYGGGRSPRLEFMHQQILYRKMGYNVGDVICSIDGSRVSEIDQKGSVFWVKNNENFPYGKYSYSTLYLNEDNIPYYTKHMNNIKPSFLRGYPSGIKLFCQLIESSVLKLTFSLQ